MFPLENYFQTIQSEAIAEFKDRGSKFIAYAFPITDIAQFKERLALIKKLHDKAVHYCFAYRLGFDDLNFRCSDDGEPSGSAGKPILGQLHSKQVTNTAIIVVRYFGGTLLGVPGLINAYKTVAALSLQLTPIIQKPITIRCRIEFDYAQMNEIQRWLKNFNAQIIQQDLQLFCMIIAEIPKVNEQNADTVFSQLQGIQFSKLP